MSSTLLSPPVAGEELGPPADPHAPWYVDENAGLLPPSVADGTWPFLYPDRLEGPQRVISPEHDHYDMWLAVQLYRYVKKAPGRDGLGYVARNVYLETLDGRTFGPDFAFYAALPFDFRPRVGRKVKVAEVGPPDLVVEILSSGTWRNDVGEARLPDAQNKMWIYAEMGVAEYWVVKPPDDFAPHWPRLRGFRLVERVYAAIPANAAGRYPSAVLATDWGVDEEEKVRLWDIVRQAWYPDPMGEAYDEEKARLNMEKTRLNKEKARLNEEIARLNAVSEQARVERVEALLTTALFERVLTTPQEQDRYRGKLQGLALDQLPTLSAFRTHLEPLAAGPARATAGKQFLDRFLDATGTGR